MTQKQAVRLEQELIRAAYKYVRSSLAFHKVLRKFRLSGAWAVTPQHHRTFQTWAKWMAPKINLTYRTLVHYSAANWEKRYQESNARTRLRFSISGKCTEILWKAIKRAHELGVKDRSDGCQYAIMHIAETYLIAMKPYRKFHTCPS